MVVTRRMACKDGGGEKEQANITKPTKIIAANGNKRSNSKGWSSYKDKIKSNIEESWSLLTNPTRCSWWPFPVFLIIAEVIINIMIIQKVNYTEIDWKAYMQVNFGSVLDNTFGP